MKTNLVICTYGAQYSIVNKQNYLKYNLSLLNKINTELTQITIMKPKINNEHKAYIDYYNFDNIDISNIKEKIVIIECENIGISYGQFLTAIQNNLDFDYHFFIEDDYIVFTDYFEEYMINELNELDIDHYLCTFYFKSKKWNMYESIKHESQAIQTQFIENIMKLVESITMNNLTNDCFIVPDHACGVISKTSVEKLIKKFNSFDNIINIFNINFKNLWMHQILFGYLLFLSGIKISDISEKNVNLFYNTGGNVTMCNFDINLNDWKNYSYNNEKMDIPIFCPIEFFYPHNQEDNIDHLKKYFINYEKFIEQYNMLNLEIKNLVTNLP
jgi:hypothetical protein